MVTSVGLLPPAASDKDRAGRGTHNRSSTSPPAPRLARRGRYEWLLGRQELARLMLTLARSDASLELAVLPGEVGASYLRRYDTRRSTQVAYARDLADWFVWLAKSGIDPYDAGLATVESYARASLYSGRAPAPATIARRLAVLSGFYRRCEGAGLVDHDPTDDATRPKVPDHVDTLGLSRERAQALVRAARRDYDPRATLLVLLMLELGLRVSEVVGADIEDLGEQGEFKVLRIRGKGQRTKAAVVPLNPAIIDAIARSTNGRTSGPLLMTEPGRRLTRQHASKIILRLGDKIGVRRLHPHELRHAFVTLALDAGETLRDVQDAARHADPRTTRRYDNNRNSLERHPTHRMLTLLEPKRAVQAKGGRRG
jgi:site-specific recombinase XerD